MQNKVLDKLYADGDIDGYTYIKEYPEYPKEIQTCEVLVIKFPSGKELKLTTMCSGCLENTSIHIE